MMQHHRTFSMQKQILHMFHSCTLEPPRHGWHDFVSTYVIGTVHGLPSSHTHTQHTQSTNQLRTYLPPVHIPQWLAVFSQLYCSQLRGPSLPGCLHSLYFFGCNSSFYGINSQFTCRTGAGSRVWPRSTTCIGWFTLSLPMFEKHAFAPHKSVP